MNTSNNNLKEFLLEKFEQIKKWVMDHLKLVVPVAVAVVALVVLIIALVANNNKKVREAAEQAAQAQNEAVAESDSGIVSVPEVPLEEDAVPEVIAIVEKYYKALADGDLDTIKQINNNVDDTEAIRIEETSKFIDSYQSIKVYTKSGPVEASYLAYVYSEVKFSDYETPVPGMQAYYICTDESGNLFFNEGEETESVINYIREVGLQDDVVDLNNQTAVAYNDMLAADEQLSVFLLDLSESIDTAVGEALASAEGTEPVQSEEDEVETGEEEATETTTETVITVRTTTTVNVRSSDSETADKLGKAQEGEEFKLIEAKGNGWSEIEYNGQSAFIKSEFLETASTETTVNIDTNEEDTTTTDGTDTTVNTNTKTNGTVTVKENVRVRASASEEGDKIATVYVGEKLDLVEKMSNGWTKIKYKGQIAYVKSDYVE